MKIQIRLSGAPSVIGSLANKVIVATVANLLAMLIITCRR